MKPLLEADLPARYRDILTIAGMLSAQLRDHIDDRSVTWSWRTAPRQ
ncbi:hypothetical protein HBB16_02505 [Pseudonocardia sp. MCCB 268]|nr:hypothetical protein [Pseudonocardia cytotoxica]